MLNPRSWRMEVGAIPPASLRGNSRAHHMRKYRDGRDWKQSGHDHGLTDIPEMRDEEQGSAIALLQKAKITFTFHHNRKIDIDNLVIGMKNWIDGLTESGLVQDDSPEFMAYGEHRFVKCKRGASKTQVLVEELR